MKRIETKWAEVSKQLNPLRSKEVKESQRLMFFAGACAVAELLVEAEKSPYGVQIIEDFGRELAEWGEMNG